MSKIVQKWRSMNGRQKAVVIIPAGCIAAAIITVAVILGLGSAGGDDEADVSEGKNETMSAAVSNEAVVTSEGTVAYGITSQYLEVSTSEYLQVEDVYVSSGNEIEEGSPLYKVTDESLDNLRETLEKALSDAQADLEEEQLSYDEQVIEAKYTYVENSGVEETALDEYEEEVESINQKIQDALEEYEKAQEIIESYPSEIENTNWELEAVRLQLENAQSSLESAQNTLESAQSEYNSKYKIYESKLEVLEETITIYRYVLSYIGEDASGIPDVEQVEKYTVSSGSSSQAGAQGGGSSSSEKSQSETKETSQKSSSNTASVTAVADTSLKTLSGVLKSEYESALSEYNIAKSNLEKAEAALKSADETAVLYTDKVSELNSTAESLENTASQYESSLINANKNLSTLKNSYEAAEIAAERQILEAQNTYNIDVTTYTNAKYYYDETMSELNSGLEAAQDAVTEAQDNLNYFESQAGDGVIKAAQSGIISEVTYEADDYITTDPLAVYLDSTNSTVTVSVAQEDMKLVNVGDETVVYASDTGMVTGTVESISSEAVSESVSNVTYDVTVSLSEESGVTEGTSVSVYFNMSVGGMNSK